MAVEVCYKSLNILKYAHLIITTTMNRDITEHLYRNCTEPCDSLSEINKKLFAFIDKKFVDEFIKVVREHSQVRTPKYPVEYYLYHILLVLNNVVKWSSLVDIRTVANSKPSHYKTIHAKHIEWSHKDLYKKTFIIMNKKYHSHLWDGHNILNLLIDTTTIYNSYGQENIGYGGNPKKQESRLSAICDVNKNIYSLTLVKSIQRTDTMKTLPNDNRTVESSVKELKHYFKDKEVNVIGDKGYAMTLQDRVRLKNKYTVNMIYPNKRNQKAHTPDEYKPLLAVSYHIENLFADLKKYNRICRRQDKLECTYMGFVYLAAMLRFKF